MQKVLLTSMILFCGYMGQAQLQPNEKLPYSLIPKKELPFSKPIEPKTYHLPERNIVIGAPKLPNNNVVALSNPLTYVGNNKQGFDVYKSGIDGMPVLMPDKENAASLGIIQKNPTPKMRFQY